MRKHPRCTRLALLGISFGLVATAAVACSDSKNAGTSAGAASDAGSDVTTGADAGSDAEVSSDAGADAAADAGAAGIDHIFLVMMENHGYGEIVGNTADAPYVNSLVSQYGVATNYYGVTHPSSPNYLATISGDFQGIFDDCAAGMSVTCAPEEFWSNSGDPTTAQPMTQAQYDTASTTAHWFSGDTLVDQLEGKQMSWKAYMQSIPGVGDTSEYAPVVTVDGGSVPLKLYAQKHNPFEYFSKIRNSAARMQRIVPFDQLANDLGAASSTPNFVWISPDQCHDMHGVSPTNAAALNIPDCAYPSSGLDHSVITLGDTFLSQLVPQIQASPAWTTQSSVIVIVWDEDDYAGYGGCCGSPDGQDGGVMGGSKVPLIVLTKKATQQTVSDPANHYALLATIEHVWGLTRLANAANQTLLTKLFLP